MFVFKHTEQMLTVPCRKCIINDTINQCEKRKKCMFDIIVQGIGFLGLIASIVSFQCKKHSRVVTLRTVNELMFAVQYFLLGAYTGMAMNIIGCIRNVIFTEMVKREKKTNKVAVAFSVVFIVFTIIAWSGPKSILVGIAKVISTFAYGNKDTKVIRWLILFTSGSWLFYNIAVNSYAGALCEIFTISSIVIAIVRIELIEKIKNKKAEAINEK